ncbi:MAG: extracellular solute-binding protein [Clostridiales bacterium]|nr:extracellular solute-binding protein [Clostridiales bacterium]
MSKKKIIAVLLALGLVLGTSCRSEKSETTKKTKKSKAATSEEDTEPSEPDDPTETSADISETSETTPPEPVTDLPFSEYYQVESTSFEQEGAVSAVFLPDMICVEILDEEAYVNQLLFFDYNGDMALNSIDLNSVLLGDPSSGRRIVTDGETIWVVSEESIPNQADWIYYLDQIDPSSGVIRHFDVPMANTKAVVLRCCPTQDGHVLLLAYQFVPTDGYFVLDMDVDGKGGHKQSEMIPGDNNLNNPVELNGNLTIFGEYDDVRRSYTLDRSTGKWTESDSDVGFWYKAFTQGDTLYGFDDEKLVRYGDDYAEIKWSDYSIRGLIMEVKVEENGDIYVLSESRGGEALTITHLIPSQEPFADDRPTVVIGGYNTIESSLPQIVDELSLLHPDVHYVIRDYMDEVSPDASKAEVFEYILHEIEEGTAPDIYYTYERELDLGELGRRGYLTDLSSYVDELDQDVYFMDQLTMGKEDPFAICITFSVLALSADPSNIQNPDRWDYTDYYDSVAQFTGDAIQGVYSKRTLLARELRAKMNQYIVDGQADFSDASFLLLLKWCKDAGTESTEDWEEYRNGKDYMLDWVSLDQIDDYIDVQDRILLSIPNDHACLHVVPRNIFSISRSCEHPELAWAVLEYALSDEAAGNSYGLTLDNSVNRNVWSKRFDEKLEDYKSYSSKNVKLSDEEYRQLYLEVIDRSNLYLFASESILDVCLSEADEYFAENCTAEDAALKIQDSVTKYLEETA